ncbi:MAG: large subunit ribosomal protein [Gaiellaceae bacterium]|jgi:large subunit ribosomal protein L22|nr:large subunit ribosomal protein [Gaiellaceae bacterium]
MEQQGQTVRAQARWVHSSARKARLVTDLIRGRSVPEARTILAFSNRAVAKDVEKVLRSAVANAESRSDLHWHGDTLVVVTAYADEGPTLKRWKARARGRVNRIRKRTCHITIELAQNPTAVAAAAAQAAAAPKRAPRKKAQTTDDTPVATETAVEETPAEETPVEETPAAEAETETTTEPETTEGAPEEMQD